MVVIGVVLVVSVAVSGLVSTYSQEVLDWIGVGRDLSPLLVLLTVLIGVAANMVLFYAMFRLLGEPDLPSKALWSGALLGALGFEVLKRLSSLLLAATKSSPGVQAFGVTLILLVWINYTTRLIMYAAAWAQTSREARAARESVQHAHAVKDASAWVSHDLPPVSSDAGSRRGRRTNPIPHRLRGRRRQHAGADGRRTPHRQPEGPIMRFERKHAVLFLAIAAWNVITYATFTKNLSAAYQSGEERATGYWVAHSVLIVVNTVIAVVLGTLGIKALKATKQLLISDRGASRCAGPC